MPFPGGFNYGGSMDLTPLENQALQESIRQELATCRMPSEWAKAASTSRHRKFLPFNRLRVNEQPLENIRQPEEFWRSLVQAVPMKDWIKPYKVFVLLAKAHPKEKPANYRLWARAQEFLDEAIRQGEEGEWADGMEFDLADHDATWWESIRLVGDAREGFGTFPTRLKVKMVKAGFSWIAVNPKVRIVPKCWESYARSNKMKFAAVASASSSDQAEQHPPASNTDSSSDSSSDSTEDDDGPYIQEGPSAVGRDADVQGAGDADDDDDDDDAVALPINAEASAALRKFMAIKPMPAPKVDPLKLTKPDTSYLTISERTTACEENVEKIAQHQVAMFNHLILETQNFVTSVLKQGLDNGPIDGRIEQVLNRGIKDIVAVHNRDCKTSIAAMVETAVEAERELWEQSVQDRIHEAIREERKNTEAFCRAEIEKAIILQSLPQKIGRDDHGEHEGEGEEQLMDPTSSGPNTYRIGESSWFHSSEKLTDEQVSREIQRHSSQQASFDQKLW